MKQIDWDKKLKNKKCQLCDKVTKEKVHFYVGGFLTYTHNSCLKIYKKAFDLREKWEKMVDDAKKGVGE